MGQKKREKKCYHPLTKILVLLSASVERVGVSPMRDFFTAICAIFVFLYNSASLLLLSSYSHKLFMHSCAQRTSNLFYMSVRIISHAYSFPFLIEFFMAFRTNILFVMLRPFLPPILLSFRFFQLFGIIHWIWVYQGFF